MKKNCYNESGTDFDDARKENLYDRNQKIQSG